VEGVQDMTDVLMVVENDIEDAARSDEERFGSLYPWCVQPNTKPEPRQAPSANSLRSHRIKRQSDTHALLFEDSDGEEDDEEEKSGGG
jgi:hypothetical protein